VSEVFRGRREDDRLLTGKGRYTADWNLPGQLYGYFVRSDRAHAEILSFRKPENVIVFTGEDTKDLRTPPPMVKYPGRGGTMIKVPPRDTLARGRVRFVGQEVALVVAQTAAAAQDAADSIEVEYRDLPLVIDVEAALAPGASYAQTKDVTIPSRPPGNYFLILKADTGGAVYEADESNNLRVVPLTIAP